MHFLHAYRHRENNVLHLTFQQRPEDPVKVMILEVRSSQLPQLLHALCEGQSGSFENYENLLLGGGGNYRYRSNHKFDYVPGFWSPEDSKAVADALRLAGYEG